MFAVAARVPRPGGRLAIVDIIREQALTDAIVCNADLLAAPVSEVPASRTCTSRLVSQLGPIRWELSTDCAARRSNRRA